MDAVAVTKLIDFRLQLLALRQTLRPTDAESFQESRILVDVAVDHLGVAAGALLHADFRRRLQPCARHHVDNDAHDDEHHEQWDADAQEHFGFQFHFLIPPAKIFFRAISCTKKKGKRRFLFRLASLYRIFFVRV